MVAKLFAGSSEEGRASVFNRLVAAMMLADGYPYISTIAACLGDIFEEASFPTQCDLFIGLIPAAANYVGARAPGDAIRSISNNSSNISHLTSVARLACVMVKEIANANISVGFEGLSSREAIVSAVRRWVDAAIAAIESVLGARDAVAVLPLTGLLIEAFRSVTSAIGAFPADLGVQCVDYVTKLCCSMCGRYLQTYAEGSVDNNYGGFGEENYSSGMLILEILGTMECAISVCDTTWVQSLVIIQDPANFSALLNLLFNYSIYTRADVHRWETEPAEFWQQEQRCEEIDVADVAGSSVRLLTREIFHNLFQALQERAESSGHAVQQHHIIFDFLVERARLMLSPGLDAQSLLSVEASLWHLQKLGGAMMRSHDQTGLQEQFLNTLQFVVLPSATSSGNRSLLLRSRAALFLADFLEFCPEAVVESAVAAIVAGSIAASHIGYKLSSCAFIRAVYTSSKCALATLQSALEPLLPSYLADTATLLARVGDADDALLDLPIFSLYAALSAVLLQSKSGIRSIESMEDVDAYINSTRTDIIPSQTLGVVVEGLLRAWSRCIFDEISMDNIISSLRICLVYDAASSSLCANVMQHFYPFLRRFLETALSNSMDFTTFIYAGVLRLLCEVVTVIQCVTRAVIARQGPNAVRIITEPICSLICWIYSAVSGLSTIEATSFALKILRGVLGCISDDFIGYYMQDASISHLIGSVSKTVHLLIDRWIHVADIVAPALGLEMVAIIKFYNRNVQVPTIDVRGVVLKVLQSYVTLKGSGHIEIANMNLLVVIHLCARYPAVIFDALLAFSRALDGSVCNDRIDAGPRFSESSLQPFLEEWVALMQSGVLGSSSCRYSLIVSVMGLLELVNWTLAKGLRLEYTSVVMKTIIDSLSYVYAPSNGNEGDGLGVGGVNEEDGEWADEGDGEAYDQVDDAFDGGDGGYLEDEGSQCDAGGGYDLSDMLDKHVAIRSADSNGRGGSTLIDSFVFPANPLKRDPLVAQADIPQLIRNVLKRCCGVDISGGRDEPLSLRRLRDCTAFRLSEDTIEILQNYDIVDN